MIMKMGPIKLPLFILIFFYCLTIKAFGYSSINFGGSYGYQAMVQSESTYSTTTTLASDSTMGYLLQIQTTFGSKNGFRFKLESNQINYQPPANGFSGEHAFQLINSSIEIPWQVTPHMQIYTSLDYKERILFQLLPTLELNLYKSKIFGTGLGISFDTQNRVGFVQGLSFGANYLYFNYLDSNSVSKKTFGLDYDVKYKIGHIFSKGWGLIGKISYGIFNLNTPTETNTGKELRSTLELVITF